MVWTGRKPIDPLKDPDYDKDLDELDDFDREGFEEYTKQIQEYSYREVWREITSPYFYGAHCHRSFAFFCLKRLSASAHEPAVRKLVNRHKKEVREYLHFVKTFEKSGLCAKGEGYFPTLSYVISCNRDLHGQVLTLFQRYQAQAAEEFAHKYADRKNVRFRLDTECFHAYQMTMCLLNASEKNPQIRRTLQEMLVRAYPSIADAVKSALGQYGQYHYLPICLPVLLAFHEAFTSEAELFGVTETLMVLFEISAYYRHNAGMLSSKSIADIFFVTNGKVFQDTPTALTGMAANNILGEAKRVMELLAPAYGFKQTSFPTFLGQVLNMIRQEEYSVPQDARLTIDRLESFPKKQLRVLLSGFLVSHAQRYADYVSPYEFEDEDDEDEDDEDDDFGDLDDSDAPSSFEFSRKYYESFSVKLMEDTAYYLTDSMDDCNTGAGAFIGLNPPDGMDSDDREGRSLLDGIIGRLLEKMNRDRQGGQLNRSWDPEEFEYVFKIWTDFADYVDDEFSWMERCEPQESLQTPGLDPKVSLKLKEYDALKEKCQQLESELAKANAEAGNKKALMAENAQLMKQIRSLEKSSEELEKDQKELVALRELLYDLSQESEEETKNISTDEKTKQIAKRLDQTVKGAFLGGHINFQNKIAKYLPSWRRYPPRSFISPDVLRNLDLLVVCTDHLDHATYLSAMANIRNQKCKVFFIHNVNVNLAIEKIGQFEEGATAS